jgi:hypothetical protein
MASGTVTRNNLLVDLEIVESMLIGNIHYGDPSEYLTHKGKFELDLARYDGKDKDDFQKRLKKINEIEKKKYNDDSA